ncbi:MAG: ABC transporter permease [Clostridiales bacterium]|jgi:peptide/nickel transport system permease protein|nr:ABC transporter permease [Clostridiales bacterium]
MLKFAVKRVVACFFVLIAVSFLSFIVLSLAPGDTAVTILTHTFIGFDDIIHDADVQTVSQLYNLDSPLILQYWAWLKGALLGNWGTSYVHNVPVWSLILSKIPYTLFLGLIAFFAAFIISVPMGLYAAAHRNGAFDHISRFVTIFFGSIPNFWLALVLIIVFCIKLNWLPVTGIGSPLNFILPGITLMVGMIPTTFRITRSSMSEVMGQDYIATAKSKGLTPPQIVSKHALVNVAPSVITMAGLEIGHILGGSVIVETIFVWPGIGKLLYDSIISKDYPMMQGCIVTISLGYIIAMFLVDVITASIDPRIRLGGSRN